MNESGITGEAATASKSGETAQELLRRTKQITRRKFAAEEKIRILLEGIRAELYFMEAGKARMRGETPSSSMIAVSSFPYGDESPETSEVTICLPFTNWVGNLPPVPGEFAPL